MPTGTGGVPFLLLSLQGKKIALNSILWVQQLGIAYMLQFFTLSFYHEDYMQ